MKNNCDSKHGIATYITTLDGLEALQIARRAAYAAGGPLGRYYVLGRWLLDEAGNISRFRVETYSRTPADLANTPAILTEEEFRDFLTERGGTEWAIVTGSNDALLPSRAVCPECGERFHIDNAHEFIVKNDPSVLRSLAAYVGKTVREAKRLVGKRRDGIYLLRDDSLLSDRAVDTKLGEFTTPQNLGWFRVDASYIIQQGDHGSLVHFRYYHPACHRGLLARVQWDEFRELFDAVGFRAFALEQIPNQYHGDACTCCRPWFDVSTPVGVIRIGWRKRVIEIDWSAVGDDLTYLFVGERVTKGPTMIHAWGRENASRYLVKIRTALEAPVAVR